ncbi:hypothetical protein AAF712_007565 [Marasmius tenuissimus]|uniref:Uncharacterized protein n=1 Tax=Marasmius tenuissimus TaxID=585030 RepID=A0ABR2ZV91_9AGAR
MGTTDMGEAKPTKAGQSDCNRQNKGLRKIYLHCAFFLFVSFMWYSSYGGCSTSLMSLLKSDMPHGHIAQLDDDDHKHFPEEFPWPHHLKTEYCIEWPEIFPATSHPLDWSFNSSFSFPFSHDMLEFYSHGLWPEGSLRIEQGTQETNRVLVDVTTHLHGPRQILNHVQVCQLKREEGGHAVGIVSIQHQGGRPFGQNIYFDVNLLLPPSSGKPLQIKGLRTWAGHFRQSFGEIGKTVQFESVDLTASGFPIAVQAESLYAKNLSIMSVVGSVEGNFTASSSLRLRAPVVNANVVLINDEKSDQWTSLSIQPFTPKTQTKADISLYTTSGSDGGKFNISYTPIRPGDESVTLNTITAPPKSNMHLSVLDVREINVSLHKTFEGRFEAASHYRTPPTIVLPKENEEDGKARKVEFEQLGQGLAKGSVWWDSGDGDSSGKKRGLVKLANRSAGKIILKL